MRSDRPRGQEAGDEAGTRRLVHGPTDSHGAHAAPEAAQPPGPQQLPELRQAPPGAPLSSGLVSGFVGDGRRQSRSGFSNEHGPCATRQRVGLGSAPLKRIFMDS